MALEVAGSKPVTRPITLDSGKQGFGLGGADQLSALWCVTAGREQPTNGEHAGVAELVDALVLGTSGESRGGSSPSARTI